MPELLLYTFIFLISYYTLAFLITRLFRLANALREESSVDIFAGPALIVVAYGIDYIRLQAGEDLHRASIFMTLFAIFMGVRLLRFTFVRRLDLLERGRERRPYRNILENIKEKYHLNVFIKIYLRQALVLFAILLPYPLINAFPRDAYTIGAVDTLGQLGIIAGAILWLAGFLFEVIGDAVLRNFRRRLENDGKVLRTGLWRFTRFPNLFGKTLAWVGIFLLAFPNIAFPYSLLAIISPLLVIYLIVFVIGIRPVEARYEGHAEYEHYKRTTSRFFPWFPKDKQKK